MRIGELATRAGVNIQTIRFYERQRLLRSPARTPAGYRSYSDLDLASVRFIKRAQQLGFTLKDVTQLIVLHGSLEPSQHGPGTRSADWQRLFRITQDRLALIDERIQLLENIRARLRAALDQGQTRLTECPASSPVRVQTATGHSPAARRRKKTD
jgi:MerR family mercuric resistance operon transcriptional regulator